MPIFHKPIKKQFHFVLYCLLAVGLALSVLCYSVIDKLMMKNAESYASHTAQKFNSEIEFLFERMDALSNSLLFDETIEKMLHSPYSSDTPKYLASLRSQFTSYSLMNRDLSEIALCSPAIAWSNYFDADTLRDFSDQLQGTYGSYCFGLYRSALISQQKDPSMRLVFGHNVYGMHDPSLYGSYLGFIILSIDPARSSITLPTADRTSTYFLLVDQHERVFSFNCSQDITDQITDQAADTLGSEWYRSLRFETPDFLVHSQQLDDTGLFMVSVMNRHELNHDVIGSTAILVGITVATLVLILFLMHLILRSIVRPLSRLSHHIDLATVSPLSEELPPLKLDGCEEIVRVSQSFNAMQEKQVRLNHQLQEATVKLYETRLGLKQAELDYLRSQINPHFLYNTLETIQALAAERHVPEIADAAGALGKLLRHNIKGAPMIPLADELEITRAYLTIQKMRFPDRLNVLESVRDNVRQLPVMKLLLQPLVENAICHGIEPKTGSGTIYIGARLDEGDLLIHVYDDGVGIPQDKLTQLQQALLQPATGHAVTHVGLLNVHNRIRLNYGEPYGLTLASTLGEGTQVTLRLPVIKEKRNDHHDESADR